MLALMIRCQEDGLITALYDAGTDSAARTVTTFEEVREILDHGQGTLWLHMYEEDHANQEQLLREVFGFHPLAIEDTLSHGYQPPKIDDFDDHIFVIAHALSNTAGLLDVSTNELNCFLGKNYLVTACHKTQITPVQQVWERALRDQRLLDKGADFLLHRLLDAIVDEFTPFLDSIDEDLDRLELEIIDNPQPKAMRRILDLKHSILAVRRIIAPQREILLLLARGDYDLISEHSQIYFRDVYDHLVRVQDLSEGVRDIVSGALDTYMSVSANKLNEVMKTLTIMSTIFMPLTLLTGVYGMNFEFMPELHWRFGYPLVWLLIVVMVVGMLWFFRRRRWI
jgi:magnesium transporter